jgi:AAA+ ATPase superfamily predicted ATPase
MTAPSPDGPLRVFISYARADELFRTRLVEHLSPLILSGEIILLMDREIRAGAEWRRQLATFLEEADVFLALISPLFFHSNFCTAVELKKALQRAAMGDALLIPVLIRPVAWEATEVARFQVLPEGAKPVSKWLDQDDAFLEITAALRVSISEYRSQRLTSSSDLRGGDVTPVCAGPCLAESHTVNEVQTTGSAMVPTKGLATGTVLSNGDVHLAQHDHTAAGVVRRATVSVTSYDFTHPATKFFRGREDELKTLCAAVRSGRSAAVFGLQRVGKTSLVERAIELASAGDSLTPIVLRIDMFSQWESFKSILDFFSVIAIELGKAEGTDPIALQKLLNEAYGSSFSEYHLQDTFRSILRKSRKITGRPIVLFIDEFQEIERAFERAAQRGIPMSFDSGVIRWLGSLIKDRDIILQVLLCCRFHAKDLEQRERMELFKLLELIDLGPLDEGSARSLVRDPVIDWIHYDEESTKRVLELTGRFPYFIQYFGYELVRRQRVIRTRQVRRKDVDDCADDIVASQINESRFSVLYEDSRRISGGQAWKVILSLARIAKNEHQLVGFSELAATCKELAGLSETVQLRGILRSLGLTQLVVEERRGPEPSYLFGPELLRRWLREQGHTRTLG